MSCKDCTSNIQGQCDACKLIDGDDSFKMVIYCKTCDAYICLYCKKDWLRRSAAYFMQKLKSFKLKKNT